MDILNLGFYLSYQSLDLLLKQEKGLLYMAFFLLLLLEMSF